MRNQGLLFIQLISCLASINNKARKNHNPLIRSKEGQALETSAL